MLKEIIRWIKVKIISCNKSKKIYFLFSVKIKRKIETYQIKQSNHLVSAEKKSTFCCCQKSWKTWIWAKVNLWLNRQASNWYSSRESLELSKMRRKCHTLKFSMIFWEKEQVNSVLIFKVVKRCHLKRISALHFVW